MVETAHSIVERFLASSLAKDVRAARQVFAEYPFSTVIDSGPTRVERGFIDLVYQDAEGWHIVDYKTDQVAEGPLEEGPLEEGPLEEGPLDVPDDHKYARQVHWYADAWESVAGEPVADAALWFADVDATVSIR
jgi:ATP-dependent helicase/nuclease subunit A